MGSFQKILKPTRARGLDTSGNNNHAQIYSGRALEFDGVTDYLNVSGSSSHVTFVDYTSETTAANRAWTVAVWFNFNAVGTANQHLIGYDDSQDTAVSNYLRISPNEKLGFYDLGGGESREANTVLNPNTWYRAVFVYNGSDTVNFYLNGVSDGSGTLTAGSNNNADLNIGLIGAKLASSVFGGAFAGKMSDFQAWQGAWTANDAEYDYLNPEQLALNRGGTSLTNSNLKLWYPMNEGHRGNQSYVLDASNTGIGDNIVDEAVSTGDSVSGWESGFGDTGLSTEDGAIKVVYNTHASGAYFYIRDSKILTEDLVVGRTYKFTIRAKVSDSEVTFKIQSGISVVSEPLTSTEYVETTMIFTATNATGHYFFTNFSDGSKVSGQTTLYIDSITLKPINAKNNATTVFYGEEQITEQVNRDFSGSGNWGNYGSSSTAPSISGGKLVCVTDGDGGNEGAQLALGRVDGTGSAYPIVAGRTYRMRAKLDNTAGKTTPDINFSLGGKHASVIRTSDNDTTGTIDTTEQEYYATITAADNSTAVLIYQTSADNDATTTFTIDDVSIKEIGTAMGWTDADQQLDIPQTALQSYNQLAWFDGAADHVSIADHNDFSFGDGSTTDSAFSVSAWVFPNEATKCRIITKQDEWLLTLNDSDKPLFSIYDDSTSHQEQKVAADAVTAGKWYHIVGTYDGTGGTSANTGMELYVNGESVGTNADAGTYAAMHNKSNAVLIGSFGTDSSFAEGCVTECSIWDKELSATEVTELYNSGLALDATTHSGSSDLIGYWRNNGLATWQDLTANDRDGTPTSITETMLITAGADSSRDSQGFLMNRQRLTNSLNINTIIDGDIDRGAYSKIETHPFYTGSAVTNYSISFWMKIGIKPSDFLSSGSFSLFDTNISNSERTFRVSVNHNNILYLYTYYGTSAGNESIYCDYDLDSLSGSIVNPPTATNNGIGEAFDPNKWYHVTWTFDHDRTTGSSSADNTNADNHNFTPYFIYINGIQVASEGREGANSAMTTARSMLNSNVPMVIGSDIGTDGNPSETNYQDFPGELDDLCFYSDTLTDKEVLRNYNAGKRSHK